MRQFLKAAALTEISGSPTFCNDDSALAVQQMTDLMTANPGLAAIVPVGGWPLFTQGAYAAFANAHKDAMESGAFTIVSADTLPMELQAVQAGTVAGLAGQRPLAMGQKAMDILVELKNGEPVTAKLRLSDAVQYWVGSFYPGQIKDIYEEITQGKPHGEITGGR